MSLCARPSSSSDSVAQLSLLTKPGSTAWPRASISSRPRQSSMRPTAAIESPTIAIPPSTGCPPRPAYNRPSRMSRSQPVTARVSNPKRLGSDPRGQTPERSSAKPRALFLLGLALDRAAGGRADLDALRLRLLRLLHVDLEDSVLVVRRDVALGDALRHADGARERPVAPLEAVEAILGLLLRSLARGTDGQRAVVELDRDVVLGDARQVNGVDDLVLCLPHVERGNPSLIGAAVPLEEAVHETTHLALKRGDLAEGLPTNQSGHFSSFPRVDSTTRIKPQCCAVKSSPRVGSTRHDCGRRQPQGPLVH